MRRKAFHWRKLVHSETQCTLKFNYSINTKDKTLIKTLQSCITDTNNFFRLKKEREFSDGLIKLQRYCAELNEEMERELNEKSWNFLVQQFCKDERFNDDAIFWYKRMREKQLAHPNAFTLNAIIKSYSNIGNADICEEILKELEDNGGSNVFSYMHLINAHLKNGNLERAFKLAENMKSKDLEPNFGIFIPLLKEATRCNSAKIGLKLVEIIGKSTLSSQSLSMSIVTFALKVKKPDIAITECGKMQKCGQMNIISWTCLIQAYVQKNDIEKTINILSEMKMSGIEPNSTTFNVVLSACANLKLLNEGRMVHNMAKKTLKEFSIELSTGIVNFYTKCECPDIAIEECELLKKKGLMNVVTWTCLVQAYVQKNDIEKTINILSEMKMNGIEPNSTTFNVVLSACANLKLLNEGRMVHNMAKKTLKEFSIELSTGIVNFYTKCECPDIAIEECELLKKSGLMDVVTWNCLIQAYIQKNDIEKTINTLSEMKMSGVEPNSTTFNVVLSACANLKLLNEGRMVHNMAKKTLKEFSIELSTGIVNFYTKCECPDIAIEECEPLKKNGLMDVVTWTCLIQAYIKSSDNQSEFAEGHGLYKAVKLYNEMKSSIEPNEITFSVLLSGCGEFVASSLGMKIIEDIKLKGMDTREEIVSGMVYFYSRIGLHETAQHLFDQLNRKIDKSKENLSIITFNNMLSCYAQHGKGAQALELYHEMVKKKVQFTEVSFIILLNAFSHCGMVDEAIQLYDNMKSKHNLIPNISVDCILVDVLARSGRFEQAEKFIGNRTDIDLWCAMMGACRKFNNIEIGEKVFKKITSIDETITAPYILLSHIFTFYGLNEKADQLSKLMKKKGIKKVPGIVYHEENGLTYKFISGSDSYPRFEQVEKMREEIYCKITKAGFKPDTRWVTNSKLLTEEEKVKALCRHAEKTAIAHAFVLNPNRKFS